MQTQIAEHRNGLQNQWIFSHGNSDKRLPVRLSLRSEVTAILRDGIISGRWTDKLPGERFLAIELNVSRPTIGLALKTLESEGIVRCSTGKKRKIVRSASRTRTFKKPVVILSPVPLESMEQHTSLWVDALRQTLAKQDTELLVHVKRRICDRGTNKLLEHMTVERPAACWILVLSTREVQQWFVNSRLPAVVAGSCFEKIPLHSADVDFQAIGRHAAGTLLSRGHETICLVNRLPIHAGDKLTELGFCEAFQRRPTDTLPPLIVHHDGTPAGIRAAMERVVKQKPPPSAYFVTGGSHVISVVSLLARSGQVLGKHYALISRDDDSFLNYMLPPISYYSRNYLRYAKAVGSLVNKTLEDPAGKPVSFQIMPHFRPQNGTLQGTNSSRG